MSKSPSSRLSNPTRLSLKSDRLGSASPFDPLNTSSASTHFSGLGSAEKQIINESPLLRPKALPHIDLTPKLPLGTTDQSVQPFNLDSISSRDYVSTPEPRDTPLPKSVRSVSGVVKSTLRKLAMKTLYHSSPERFPLAEKSALTAHAIVFAAENKNDPEVAFGALHASRSAATSEFDKEALSSIAVPSVIRHISDIQALILKTYHQAKTPPEGTNWKFCFDSKSISNTLGYYGQVWINQDKKEIVLISSGTKLFFKEFEGSSKYNLYGIMHLVKDLINDIQLFANAAPSQYKGVRKFIDLMVAKFKENSTDLSDYDIIFAGHSLGAITSDMGMLYARTKHNLDVHSITMENPGSAPSMNILAESMKKHAMLPVDYDVHSVVKHCTVVNNEPNWINTTCKQFGDVYRNLVRQYKTQELPPFCKYLPTTVQDLLLESLKQSEFHHNGHFGTIPDMELQKTWPVGVFKSIMIEKIANAITSVESSILGSPILSSLLIDSVKLVKIMGAKIPETKQKLLDFYDSIKHDTEEFLEYLQSFDEIGGIGDTDVDSVVA